MKPKLIKYLIIFFISMACFTVISRISNSVTIAKVKTSKAETMNLTYDYNFPAQVVGKENSIVVLPKNVIIENIYVEENNLVSVGSPLVSINKDSLDNKIEELVQERDKLQSQYNTDFSTYQGQLNKSNLELETAKLQLKNLKESREKKITDALNEIRLAQKNNEETTELEKTYEDMTIQFDENIQAEEKNINLASQNLNSLSDSSLEIYLIDINRINLEIQSYEEIINSDYTIYSNFSGSVNKISSTEGSETTVDSTILLSDKSKGIKLSGVIPIEEKNNYKIGQKVSVQKNNDGKNLESMLEITKIYETKNNEILECRVEVSFPENMEYPGDLNLNDDVIIDATKSSLSYKYCTPISSIKMDSNGDTYIQYVSEKESILGLQLIIEKMDVVILEKNNRYAAIKEDNALNDIMIITDSNKELYENDRVFVENGISDE